MANVRGVTVIISANQFLRVLRPDGYEPINEGGESLSRALAAKVKVETVARYLDVYDLATDFFGGGNSELEAGQVALGGVVPAGADLDDCGPGSGREFFIAVVALRWGFRGVKRLLR